jgi:hypothetical protein
VSQKIRSTLLIGAGVTLGLIGAVAGCHKSASAAPPDTQDTQMTPPEAAQNEVEVAVTATLSAHPPLAICQLDLTLRNTSSGSRWFVLPWTLPAAKGTVGVSTGTVSQTGGPGRIIVGNFRGSKSFHAIYLPAGAQVTLHKFPLETVGRPDTVDYKVIVATAIKLGDDDVTKWFGGTDPLSDASVDTLFQGAKQLSSYKTSDGNEVPITITQDHVVDVTLSTAPAQ